MQHPTRSAPTRSRESALQRVRRCAPRVAAVVVLGVLVVLGRVFVVAPVRIASDSMTPTLLRGDVVLVDRRALDISDLSRGDLVTFENPKTEAQSLKRVVALPGDTVAILDAVLHVNGTSVEEPYVDFSEWDGTFTARVTVPDDAVYVLGDDRLRSVDSRGFGAVPVERLDGRVLVRLWPPVRVGADPPQPHTP